MKRSLSVALFLSCLPRLAAAPAPGEDRAALLAGVQEIVAPGCVPGGLVVFGDGAFVALTGRMANARVPMIAAARFGAGRSVACGHEGFFGTGLKRPDNRRLLANIARWAPGKTTGPRVGALDQAPEALEALRASGCRLSILRPEDLPTWLTDLDLLWMNQASLDGPAHGDRIAAVREWVKRGGGLVVAGPAWGWQQLHPNQDLLKDHTGNRLLLPMGIAFSAAMLEGTGREGYATAGDIPALADAPAALDALDAHAAGRAKLEPGDLAQVTVTLSQAVGVLPEDDPVLLPRVLALCARHGGDAVPDKKTPITSAMPFARLKAVLDVQRNRRLPVERIAAHPAAASFPGTVPADAPRESRTLSVDTRRPAWHGTGLYAAPGEAITVTVPPTAAGKGLGIRIGAHTDGLWHLDRWTRFPEVSIRRRLDAPSLRIASTFGGTIFLEVPERCALGSVPVAIANAVAQPRYTRGVTSLDEWRKKLRAAPAPWAELEGRLVILSVPAAAVRELDDPEALMAYWDQVMEQAYTLYAAPRRSRPERYCVDRQISAGYMHSGYPIMVHDDVAATICDVELLRGSSGIRVWGFYHEMGHNFQRPEWTWDAMGEVTENFLSLYAAERINGVAVGAHPAMTAEEMRKRVEAVATRPGAEAYYRRDPWYPLTMFALLRRGFGWEAFTRVFAEFRDLPDAGRPRSDDEKRDQFLIRFSWAAGRDIGGYLAAWGVQTSPKARAAVAHLPAWMPDDWPKATGAGGAGAAP